MNISEIVAHLESFAPRQYQETYDNSGMITGDPDQVCSGILICLDCTEEIVREAITKKCNLIVSHHPLIFRPIRNILRSDGVGRAIISAIQADITIYAIHTNLDNVLQGVNSTIAEKLELQDVKILRPQPNQMDVGSGIVGDLKIPVDETDFLAGLQRLFKVPVVRHTNLRAKPISRVAVCGGAGSFLIINALCESADIFITADLKYHDFFEGEGKMIIADIGHYESEQYTIDLLCKVILEKFPNFAVLKSVTKTNPVNYYI